MQVNDRQIGEEHPPYIIAEIGAGHRSIEDVTSMMRTCHSAGVSAFKLQVYTPGSLTLDCEKDPFQIKDGLWKGERLWSLYAKAHTPDHWLEKLFDHAQGLGITLFASAFHPKDVELLEHLGCPAYKIASCEIAYDELLLAVRDTGKPVFLSTGMASNDEIRFACNQLDEADLCLMHCVSGYPTPRDQANLKALRALEHGFRPDALGFSDHTVGDDAAVCAIALGASVIEKHVAMPGSPDGGFALRPYEMSSFVQRVNAAWDCMRGATATCEESTKLLRRSVFAVADIAEGEELSPDNIRVIRPAGGLHPRDYPLALAKKARATIARGTPITWELVD